MKKNILFFFFSLMSINAICQNIPRPNIDAPQGLQVNSFTGNLFYGHSDITLRGVGFPVYGTFYYNAATDTLDYGFGHGWNFYYNIFYSNYGDSIIISQSDAKKDTFRFMSAGFKSPTGVFDILTKNGAEYILTSKDGIRHYFSDPVYKKLTRITDPNGNFIRTVYSSGGVLAKVQNSSGRSLLLNWTNGKLQSIQDSALPAKNYSYGYNSNNELVSISNPLGASKTFAYFNHFLVRLADENTNPVVIQYGAKGKVRSINSCGTTISFNFLDEMRKTLVTYNTAAGNLLTTYDFDIKGRLISVTDPANKKVFFTYDNYNNLVQSKDWKGQVTVYNYDAKGNMLSETDPQGNAIAYTYEPQFNKTSSVKDKRGQTATLNYNSNGNLVSVIKPQSVTETYDYFANNGNLKTFINANSKSTGYEYNTDGDLTKITYPIGSQQFEYSGSCCNLSKITDGNGNSVSMTYDLMNRVKTVKDDLNNTIQNNYDAAGNLVTEKDANNHTKSFGYDALNRLTNVSLPGTGTWNYKYDGVGNLTELSDANTHKTLYGYNNKNQLVKETDALGNATSYIYDDNGNVLSKVFPNGNTIQYKYDELNRLIQKDYAGNSDKYSYDANGNLISAYNNNITYTFEYNNLNRLTKKNIVNWGKSISYTYDALGNRLTMTDHDGGQYLYTYDNNNRLTSLKNPFNLTTNFEYDLGGRLTKQINQNGIFTNYSYDVAGRLVSLQNKRNVGPDISFFNYTFDNQGNRTSLTDKYGLNNYTYDSSYRLTNVQYAGGNTESFSIDPTGNRTQQVKNGVPVNYTYNSSDQLLTAGVSSFQYDANGNTTQQTDSLQKKYDYDGENRLVKASINSVKAVQWLYDPFGEKIQRTDTSGAITKFIYDGDNLLTELSNSNTTITKYTTAFGIDSWIGFNRAGNNYFYHKDGLNSVTEITDNAGLLLNHYRYDAYGNILSQSGTLQNRVMYTGRLWEGTIKLYDYRNRFYNAAFGMFLVKDKIHGALNSPQGLNLYNYVLSNPVNLYDPMGYSASKIGLEFCFEVEKNVIEAIPKSAKNGTSISDEIDYADIAIGMIPIGRVAFAVKASIELIKYGLSKAINFTGSDIRNLIFQYKINKAPKVSGECLDRIIARNGGGNFIFTFNSIPKQCLIGKSQYGPPPAPPTFDDLENELRKRSESSQTCSALPPNQPGPNEPTPDNGTPDTDIPGSIEVFRAGDPNEIIGTEGYGNLKWVSYKAQLPYQVNFENDPDSATAPAQRVAIYMPINNKLNPNSLRLGDFGFGSFNFTVPPNLAVYSKRLDVRDSLGVFVDVTAGLDIPNRRAFWIFESIDPLTGLSSTLPVDKGFLPVNDSITHKGEGYVTLTIQPADNVHTRETSNVYASIIFDDNDAVNTNTWVNTIDAKAPTSAISLLPNTSHPYFPVYWSGVDDTLGVGLHYYDIYYSKNNGPFTLLKQQTESDSLVFPGGDIGATYSFFSAATDYTGNREALKNAGETSTLVLQDNESICAGNDIAFNIPSFGPGYNYQWQLDTGAGFINISDNSFYSGTNTNILTVILPPTSWYGYKYRCIAVNGATVITGSESALKFKNVWKGTTSSAWETGSNWSCNSVPDQYTDVYINTGTPNKPVLSSNGFCRKLNLGKGAEFTVNGNFILEVKGR